MAIEAQTLNQYVGTDAQGNGVTIVAPDMETACNVYNTQESTDPTIMQCTKRGVKCVLPTQYVTFNSEAWDSTGTSAATCSVTPGTYTVTAGTEQIFTAKAGEGWRFSKWLINGVDAEGGEVAMLTLPTSETGLVTVRAVFETA